MPKRQPGRVKWALAISCATSPGMSPIRDAPLNTKTKRSTLGSLHAALEEEDHLASALMEEQEKAMKEAVDSLREVPYRGQFSLYR